MVEFWLPTLFMALFLGLVVVLAFTYELKLLVLAAVSRGRAWLRSHRAAQRTATAPAAGSPDAETRLGERVRARV